MLVLLRLIGGAKTILLGIVPLFLWLFKDMIKADWFRKNKEMIIGIALILLFAWVGWYLFRKYIQTEKTIGNIKNEKDDVKAAIKAAYAVADRLGTNKAFSWWQTISWTEDEEGAYKIIVENSHIISEIEVQYRTIAGNDLLQDIERLMPYDLKQKLYSEIWLIQQ